MGWLRDLQDKPREVRAQIALGSALSFTLVIAVVWFVSLPARLASDQEVSVEEIEQTDEGGLFSSIANLKNRAAASLGAIREDSVEPTERESEPASENQVMDIADLIKSGAVANEQVQMPPKQQPQTATEEPPASEASEANETIEVDGKTYTKLESGGTVSAEPQPTAGEPAESSTAPEPEPAAPVVLIATSSNSGGE